MTFAPELASNNYISFACFTLLYWDHMLTFPDEVNYMWSQPFCCTKTLLLLNRYALPLLLTVDIAAGNGVIPASREFCSAWFVLLGYAQFATIAIGNYLFALRIHALWSRSRNVFILLWAAFVVYVVAEGLILTLALVERLRTPVVDEVLGICITPCISWEWASCCVLLAYNLYLFGLTAIKAHVHVRQGLDSRLLGVLYRDGFIYHFVLASVTSVNIVLQHFVPEHVGALHKFFLPVVVNVMVSRVILNLRRVHFTRFDLKDASRVVTRALGNGSRLVAETPPNTATAADRFVALDSSNPAC